MCFILSSKKTAIHLSGRPFSAQIVNKQQKRREEILRGYTEINSCKNKISLILDGHIFGNNPYSAKIK